VGAGPSRRLSPEKKDSTEDGGSKGLTIAKEGGFVPRRTTWANQKTNRKSARPRERRRKRKTERSPWKVREARRQDSPPAQKIYCPERGQGAKNKRAATPPHWKRREKSLKKPQNGGGEGKSRLRNGVGGRTGGGTSLGGAKMKREKKEDNGERGERPGDIDGRIKLAKKSPKSLEHPRNRPNEKALIRIKTGGKGGGHRGMQQQIPILAGGEAWKQVGVKKSAFPKKTRRKWQKGGYP